MKLRIVYTPSFLRELKKLPKDLQKEVKEKIDLFSIDPTHSFLKTHKLKGRLRGQYSFWVNYEYRIVFQYDSKSTAALLSVGDHEVYK